MIEMVTEAKRKIELIKAQEALLIFDRFSSSDALELGLMFVSAAKLKNVPIAIEIKVNQSTLFCYRTEKTSPYNDEWLRRKGNTVSKLGMSTLQTYYTLIAREFDLEKDMHLNHFDYAHYGGGFPIHLKGTGNIGSICVSALPHEEDHALLIEVIGKFLSIEVSNEM